jgi:hypothetical protein
LCDKDGIEAPKVQVPGNSDGNKFGTDGRSTAQDRCEQVSSHTRLGLGDGVLIEVEKTDDLGGALEGSSFAGTQLLVM